MTHPLPWPRHKIAATTARRAAHDTARILELIDEVTREQANPEAGAAAAAARAHTDADPAERETAPAR